jgi:hypothetical protein
MVHIHPSGNFLVHASEASLEAFELSRLNTAANLRRQFRHLLDAWVEAEAEARVARWALEWRAMDPHSPLSSPGASSAVLKAENCSEGGSQAKQAQDSTARESLHRSIRRVAPHCLQAFRAAGTLSEKSAEVSARTISARSRYGERRQSHGSATSRKFLMKQRGFELPSAPDWVPLKMAAPAKKLLPSSRRFADPSYGSPPIFSSGKLPRTLWPTCIDLKGFLILEPTLPFDAPSLRRPSGKTCLDSRKSNQFVCHDANTASVAR